MAADERAQRLPQRILWVTLALGLVTLLAASAAHAAPGGGTGGYSGGGGGRVAGWSGAGPSAIVEAWTAHDHAAPAKLAGPDLMVERCRLDDFDRKGWHNITEPRVTANQAG